MYLKAFKEVKDFIEDLYRTADYQYLSEINFHFLQKITNYLGIDVDYDMIDIKNKIDIDIEPNSAVITTSALEQVGGDIDSFIDFVIEHYNKSIRSTKRLK